MSYFDKLPSLVMHISGSSYAPVVVASLNAVCKKHVDMWRKLIQEWMENLRGKSTSLEAKERKKRKALLLRFWLLLSSGAHPSEEPVYHGIRVLLRGIEKVRDQSHDAVERCQRIVWCELRLKIFVFLRSAMQQHTASSSGCNLDPVKFVSLY